MKAHDIRAALSDLPELTITSSTTDQEDAPLEELKRRAEAAMKQ